MALRPEPELGWLPTHVQVTIMQAKGLRAKGKHGTSDAFTLIQIGREKYSTSVVEKTSGSPEWKEECSFELAPGALERGEGCALQLTIMHRALIGMDQFLGQVSIPLQEVYKQGRSLRNQWYKLCSKPSRKEKERGEIQVSIQFTRNNLTASMFDLSIKDKPKTPFGKLKDKMKVKKLFDMESSSAIVPSSVGRLDSDDEDDRKPKTKGAFFLKGRLRKNSLTRSNTSLGSDSTISSASGTVPTSTGISIVVPDVGKKPAVRNSSLSSEPAVKDHEASPRMTHKRAFSDEVGQVKMFPEPKAIQDLKSTSSPISKSSLCINGSHVYNEVPLPKPSPSPLEKSTPQSRSFQNFVKKPEDPVAHEGLRAQLPGSEKPERTMDWKSNAPPTIIPEVKNVAKATGQPQESEDVRHEFKPVHITTPLMFSENTSKTKSQEGVGKDEKKPKVNHYGTGDKGVAEQAPHGSVNAEERGKAGGWFGSKDPKDAPQKPSLDVSPQVETSSSASSSFTLDFLSRLTIPSPVDGPVCMPIANPNAASYSGVCGSLPVNNPFLNSVQNNPFYEDLLSDKLLNTSSPTRFFSSLPSGSIAASEAAEWGSSLVEEHSPLAFYQSSEDEKQSSSQGESAHRPKSASSSSSSEPIATSEWEDQFDAFASSRLKPTTENQRPLETKAVHSNVPFLNSRLYVEGTGILAEKSPAVSEHSVNILPVFCKSNPTVHILETHWPVNLLEMKDPKSEDTSPYPVSFYTPHIPTAESTKIRPPDNDSSTLDHSKAITLSEKLQRCFDSSGRTSSWSLDEDLSITEVSKIKSVPLEPVTPKDCNNEQIAVVSKVKGHGTLQNPSETTYAITRIAEVPPMLSNEHFVAKLPDLRNNQLLDQQASSQFRSNNPTKLDIKSQDIQHAVVHFLETLQNPTRPAGGAQRETISYKSGALPNEDIIKTIVGGWVNEPEVRMPFLRETVGSMVAPKPPRLLLSPTPEEKPTDGDNCEKTSNQDLNSKQMENPEEQMLEKSNGLGKQTVSPVTCCPVIGVRSPVQSIGEDTQSTTEGISVNLKEGNNELTKLGATNGEHLLDVNESTVAGQFWTCPSKVSLDVLDLSRAEVRSSKLDVLKVVSGPEIINHIEPSKPLMSQGAIELASEKLLKHLPMPKNDEDRMIEPSSSSQRIDHSALFWSALEEQLPTNLSEPFEKGPDEANALGEVVPKCEQTNDQGHMVQNVVESKSGLTFPRLEIVKSQCDVLDHSLPLSAKDLTAENQSGVSLSQLSSWSADIVVDFKNEGFWKSESDLLEDADAKSFPSPSNPFISTDRTPPPSLSENNPFAECSQSSQSTEVSLQDDMSFKDLHAQTMFKEPAPPALPITVKLLSLHDRQPLAFSTPSLVATQNSKLSNLPSPILSPMNSGVVGPTNSNTAALTCLQSPVASCGLKTAVPSVLPKETLPAENPLVPLKTSPHPVKPISATVTDPGQEKKPSKPALSAALSSGLEKLKSVAGGHPQTVKNPDLDRFKDLCTPDVAAKYYHLTHDELIHLLLQKEVDLGKKDEHVRELEEYIDKLLVRIMEQAPTLLQAPLETKKDKKC